MFLIETIQKIAQAKNHITLTNLDARHLIKQVVTQLPDNSLVYLDPPYYHKGQKLYLNAYLPDDHILLAHSIKEYICTPWIVSYDNTVEISDLYSEYRKAVYPLNYTAADRYHGSEIIIYSEQLAIPEVPNPFMVTKSLYKKLAA